MKALRVVQEDVSLLEPDDIPLPDTQSPYLLPQAGRGSSVSVRGLAKAFGANQVLRGIDLEIPAGQFVAIVGRSGCGKSTLLRLLAGLEQPDAGTITFDDGAEAKTRCASCSRSRGYCPGRACCPMSRSASARAAGSPMRGSAPKPHSKPSGLSEKRDQWPSTLSGGQKQRAALARALVSQPRVLALDEPLGALDALTRISMQRLLSRVWREQGFTSILVTHDVAEAVTLADRILLIEEGRIALDFEIALRRPRERGSSDVAAIEGKILRYLFRDARDGDDA